MREMRVYISICLILLMIVVSSVALLGPGGLSVSNSNSVSLPGDSLALSPLVSVQNRNNSCSSCAGESDKKDAVDEKSTISKGEEDQLIRSIDQFITQNDLNWEAGSTSVSGLTPELKARMLGVNQSVNKKLQVVVAESKDTIQALPTSLDWRNYKGGDWTTPIRNQGLCGSCWAFAATAVFESWYERSAKNSKLNPDFAEQYLLSCNKMGYSCNGGWVDVLNYFVNYQGATGGIGIVTEKVYPYVGQKTVCKSLSGQSRYKTKSGTYWSSISGVMPTVSQIKSAVYKYGPVSVSMWVDNTFYLYTSGIWETPNTYNNVNHAVMIVGWGYDSLKKRDYWICKNSWGTGWGEKGWFRIYADEANIGYGGAYFYP